MNGFFPSTGSPHDWNAAYYRLEDYLRAHGAVNKIHQSQIILRLLQRAAERHRLDPSEQPLALAMSEAHEEMVHWFRRIFSEGDSPPDRLVSLGRVSLYLLGAAERWPNILLAEGELPAEFIHAMRSVSMRSGPDLRVSTMVPRVPTDALEVEKKSPGSHLSATSEEPWKVVAAMPLSSCCTKTR